MSMLSRFATTSSGAAAATITYVGGYAVGVTSGTSSQTITFGGNLTGGIASSASADDLVIVYYSVNNGIDLDLVVTGYVEVADLYSADSQDANLVVAYKVMGGTPDTTVTVSATGASTSGGAIAIQVWRNVDTTLPLDVAAVTATGINSVLCNPPAITPSTAGAVIVAGGAGAYAAATNTYSSSDLTGFISAGSANVTSDAVVGVGYKVWTSGAFDPAAFTFSDTDSLAYSWAAVTLALRPVYSGTKPTFIASASTQNTAAGTSLVINKPTGTQAGDLMIAIMGTSNGAATWTGDTGWTEIVDQGASPNLRIAYKVAGSSEGSSYTFTSSATLNCAGSIFTYRNAAYDAIGAITTTTNTSTPTGPTAAAAFSMLIGCNLRANASYTITPPSSMTTRVTDSDVNAPSYAVADEYVIAGATGTRSFTSSGTGGTSSGILLTIKPA